ncbi:DUF1800 domain-containing protein [Limnohabitans lacus]|uniref:DUF1800 family protein n=1 Tax=Limnohabitans lacus TaxID=3045173 RepID=A0ABT6XAP7_9BURK|nr:DUF1800 family protein [Limnohabitans sp. HM2-2]MDI9235206.1 DUF1800 family protein [Limnohabitans sp. HM2-2]
MILFAQHRLFALLLLTALLVACGGGEGTEGKAVADPDDGVLAGLLAAPVTEEQATRFLWKSAFGPTDESIALVRRLGYAGFVDRQLNLQTSQYSNYLMEPYGYPGRTELDGQCAQHGTESTRVCLEWIYEKQRAPSVIFFKSAVHDPDQLRLRVAFALSQILVVSMNLDYRTAYGMRSYQQMLRNMAFGNYRDVLMAITMHPYMGAWLDHAKNTRQAPNQNFARELLQLFSVGTYLLNQDGTYQLNARGELQETYTEAHVRDFSRALTGWTYPASFMGANLTQADDSHDTGSKTLLRGQILPANQSTTADLQGVIDNVFNHPNTGPYVCRQLIQFLVTSNPSPAYVARVVKVFNKNSSNARGDLKAVVRAILLDSEALNPPDAAGRLLEPAIASAGLVRAVGGASDGAYLDEMSFAQGQRPFAAPSVFNFYSFQYQLPVNGRRLQAPQFAIATLPAVTARLQYLDNLLSAGGAPADTSLPQGYRSGTQLSFPARWLQLAGTNVDALVDMLNVRLAGGVLTPASRNLIAAQVKALPGVSSQDQRGRVALAIFMVAATPHFMTHR